MRILSDASYLRLVINAANLESERASAAARLACHVRAIERLERGRTDYEQKIYEAQKANAELCEKNSRLRYNLRSAERRVQELTLLCGMKGFAVEMTPDTPAVPAKPGVLTLTKILKS